MAFEVYQKYTDSWRLDHPNFKDVQITSYQKGIITDWQKVQDDPLQVSPLVKVDIGGDWLPLFYHPKKQFWDTDEHAATDYNQDNKYFENAWMSFRADDEVVVMLRDGVPYMVLGFADGTPKVGEDIVKIHLANYAGTAHDVLIQCSKEGHQYARDSDEGPDGNDLGLSLQVDPLCDTGERERYRCYEMQSGGNQAPCGFYEHYCGRQEYYYYDRYMEWLVVVGPLMYLFQTLIGRMRIYGTIFSSDWDFCHTNIHEGWTDWVYNAQPFDVLAAIYDKDLYEATKSKGQANSGLDPYNDIQLSDVWKDVGSFGYYDLGYGDKFIYQDQFTSAVRSNQNLFVYNAQAPSSTLIKDMSTALFNVRPH